MNRSNRSEHIRLTSHPEPGAKLHFPIKWGAATARERGPIIGTVSQPQDRNVIGSHGGSYAIYRALAVSSGALDPIRRPDLSNTYPAANLGQFAQWSEPQRIISLDPWGHLVATTDHLPRPRRMQRLGRLRLRHLHLPSLFDLRHRGMRARRPGRRLGVIIYNRKEGRALGEVTKFLVYNARKRQEGGDAAAAYFERTECVAGVQDARFQQLMPDAMHWLGLKRIDRFVSMSDMKYDALMAQGVDIVERVPIPGDLIPADAHVEIAAKKAAGYYSTKPPKPQDSTDSLRRPLEKY